MGTSEYIALGSLAEAEAVATHVEDGGVGTNEDITYYCVEGERSQ